METIFGLGQPTLSFPILRFNSIPSVVGTQWERICESIRSAYSKEAKHLYGQKQNTGYADSHRKA